MDKIDDALKGLDDAIQGKASLDEDGKVPSSQLPDMDYIPDEDGSVTTDHLADDAVTADKLASGSVVSDSIFGTISVEKGGTGNSNGTVAKLTTARTIRTSLSSTSTESFDGSANVTPGVNGVLPISNGGTGNSSFSTTGAVYYTGTGLASYSDSTQWGWLSAYAREVTYYTPTGSTSWSITFSVKPTICIFIDMTTIGFYSYQTNKMITTASATEYPVTRSGYTLTFSNSTLAGLLNSTLGSDKVMVIAFY